MIILMLHLTINKAAVPDFCHSKHCDVTAQCTPYIIIELHSHASGIQDWHNLVWNMGKV